jgi:hypothetical protein
MPMLLTEDSTWRSPTLQGLGSPHDHRNTVSLSLLGNPEAACVDSCFFGFCLDDVANDGSNGPTDVKH